MSSRIPLPNGSRRLPLRRLALVALLGCMAPFAQAASDASAPPAAESPALTAPSPALDQHPLLDEWQRACFLFFAEQTHPRTGLVRDRALADGGHRPGIASIGASGFAFTGWAIAAHRGWVPRAEALEQVRVGLRFLADEAVHKNGFFYHFYEMDSGERWQNSEVSSVDTALMLFGALVAREHFQDPELTALVAKIQARIDWRWFTNGGSTLVLSWHETVGFSRWRWDNYAEHTGMYLLALAAPSKHALPPEFWHNWQRGPLLHLHGRTFLEAAPLFIHQFSHAYFDYRDQRDAYADYFKNSVLATLAQRQWSIDLRPEFPAWGPELWGVTASDGPNGYMAWGGPPRTGGRFAVDGSIVPCAAGGSLPFAPRETLETLTHMRSHYGDRLWKRYGFADAFNPHTGWVASDVIGIDVGITLVQIENARTGWVWETFMKSAEAQRGLALAGFVSTAPLPAADAGWLRELATSEWQRLAARPAERGTTAAPRLTALLAAHALGLVPPDTALAQARQLVNRAATPKDPARAAQFAAALVATGQAFPALASATEERLAEIVRPAALPDPARLGDAARLGTFLKISRRIQNPDTWQRLDRAVETRGPVSFLAPGWSAGLEPQALPGLWLDESPALTRASAAQLAYGLVQASRDAGLSLTDFAPGRDRDARLRASVLALDHFPAEALRALRVLAAQPPSSESPAAAADTSATVLAALANHLTAGRLRAWFGAAPEIARARAQIADFKSARFGAQSSVFAQRELAPLTPKPPRLARVVRASLPASAWEWHELSAPEFKESTAEIFPDDPRVALRFAFAWDTDALVFVAEATDDQIENTHADTELYRGNLVELFLGPDPSRFTWGGARDAQFGFAVGDRGRDFFRKDPFPAKVTRTAAGYRVEARIPWSRLGLKPTSGLQLGASPVINSVGTAEEDPHIRLNWRYDEDFSGRTSLGTLVLE